MGLILRNAADGPLKYQAEQFDVILGDRTIPHPKFKTLGGVIPRGSTTILFYQPFKREVVQPRVEGVIRYTILYGHPELSFSRRSKKELSVTLRLDKKPGIVWLTENESDEAL